MLRKSKILSLLLCFCLLFEQTGFAQVAGALDISGHIAAFRNSFIQDKFRPLHLRSIGYDNNQNNFRLLLDKGDLKNPKKPDLEITTKNLLNYFFVGVTLPNDAFWVNLRPDSENNIIDPDLATTDVGKILLEADLQLKKDTAKFTSPETPEGKEYWDKLYQKAGELLGYENVTIPTLTRPWIVPGEIIIRETKDNAYIYKATLKVMLEQDYLKDSSGRLNVRYNFDDPRLKTLNEYSSQLIRDLIIPKLTKEVNTSQRYASLRQVYYSLILAQWFKSRFYGKSGLYSWLIDRRGLQGLTSKISWSKTTYFKAYQKSFKDGEYNIQQPVYTPYGQTIRSYFSGGFVCNVPMPAVPAPGVAAERTEGPTKVTAISGDVEHNPLPRTESVVGALAVGGNTMDPSETKVTITDGSTTLTTEEASSPSGLPAGGLQSGASSPVRKDEGEASKAEEKRKAVIDEIKQIAAKANEEGINLSEVLGARKIRMTNTRLAGAAQRYFGSWEEAIRTAGFDYEAIKQQPIWSREKIIDAIQQLATEAKEKEIELSEVLGIMNIKKSNAALCNAAQRYFGSWEEAIRTVGFDYETIRENVSWSPEKIIAKIQQLAAEAKEKEIELSEVLCITNIQKSNAALCTAAQRYFGSWEEAIRTAGFDYEAIKQQPIWSAEKVIADIKQLAAKAEAEGIDLSEVLSSREIQKTNNVLYKASMRYFGSWATAVMRAGIPYFEAVVRDREWLNLRRQIPPENISLAHPGKFQPADYQGLVNSLQLVSATLSQIVKSKTQGEAISEKVQQQTVDEVLRLLKRNGNQTTDRELLDLLLGLIVPQASYSLKELTKLAIDFLDKRLLNDKAQEISVRMALATQNKVVLLHGPAGSGKTFVITELARQFSRQGKKVLVTTYTNEALDNILDVLVEVDKTTLLGRAASRVEAITKETLRPRVIRTPGDLSRFVRQAGTLGFIIGATHIGLETVWALRETELDFDVVIIDEASQTNLASALVPLLRTKAQGKAILVGDHKQLPPFGLSKEDLKQLQFSKEVNQKEIIQRINEIFQSSIFEALINSPQFNRIMLSTNYRWHWAIAKPLSELFYEGRLAAERQEEPLLPDTFKVIDTTKQVQKAEESVNSSFKNLQEALLAIAEIKRLIGERVLAKDIGVISFYKAQVEQIQRLLESSFTREIANQIKVATVDSFQGREKKVIILSATRSNNKGDVGFLNDLRRLNVALSRARDRLIIIGDFSTLTKSGRNNQVADIFERVLSYAEELSAGLGSSPISPQTPETSTYAVEHTIEEASSPSGLADEELQPGASSSVRKDEGETSKAEEKASLSLSSQWNKFKEFFRRGRKPAERVEEQIKDKALGIARAHEQLRHPEDYIVPAKTDAEQELVALAQSIAKPFGIAQVILVDDRANFAGAFIYYKNQNGESVPTMLINQQLAYQVGRPGGVSQDEATETTIHELAHLLEEFMRNDIVLLAKDGFVAHLADFTHDAVGTFAEAMKYISAVTLVNRQLSALEQESSFASAAPPLAGVSGSSAAQEKYISPATSNKGDIEGSSGLPVIPQADNKGGIDFRALPIVNQQINMGMLKLSAADLNRLSNINLDSEWGEIQNMVNAGIIPSNERIKEYVLASCLRQNLGNQMNKVLGCIADIMRMEEDRVTDADVELKDMLVLIEAGKPESELGLGLSQIKISPQEP